MPINRIILQFLPGSGNHNLSDSGCWIPESGPGPANIQEKSLFGWIFAPRFFGRPAPIPVQARPHPALAPGFPLLAAGQLWVVFGEELGWRGFALPRLELLLSPRRATVVLALIWGVWHYPLNLRGYNYPDHPILGLVIFPVSAILLSIIFGWLRLRTGSIWSASLAHAATNAMGASLTALLFLGGADLLWVGYLGVLSWIPLGAVCAWIVLTGRLKGETPPKEGQQP